MRAIITTTVGLLVLAGCSGNPINFGGDVSTGGNGLCEGTNVVCVGEVNQFDYDPDTDTLSINNLPFDLDGTYERVAALDRGDYRAYRNSAGGNDYFALYRQTEFSEAGVVGTDDYLGFGYGGGVFRARGAANLPNSGEAEYFGPYAGVRIYQRGNPLGYTTGNIRINVDFDDFDDIGAIDIRISDRRAFDENGNYLGDLPFVGGVTTQFDGIQIQETTIAAIDAERGEVGTGTLSGIFTGPNAEEIAGILILTSTDVLNEEEDIEVRENGAFIIPRTIELP